MPGSQDHGLINKLAYKTMVLTGYSTSKTPILKTGLNMFKVNLIKKNKKIMFILASHVKLCLIMSFYQWSADTNRPDRG